MFENIWKNKAKNKSIAELKNKIVSSNAFICLSELECGRSAKIVEFKGNPVLVGKLKAMGIFSGATIFKKSAIPAKGSIIVEKGVMQFAFEYNIAEKIIVERL